MSMPPPPGPPGLGEPPTCCPGTKCCLWNMRAEYNCESAAWTVTVFGSPVPGVECQDDTEWTVSADPCLYVKSMYVPGGPTGTCGSPPTPAPPSGEPAGCCPGTCCLWLLTTTYSCVGGYWPPATGEPVSDVACGTDTDWAPTADPCTYKRNIYISGPCTSPPVVPPPLGGGIPPDCCSTCCRWVFNASWGGENCESTGWSVVVVSGDPDVPCGSDSGWTNGADACTKTRIMYTPGACSSPPDPGEPTGGDRPSDCCCCYSVPENCPGSVSGPWCNYVYEGSCDDIMLTFVGGIVENVLPGSYRCGSTVSVRINQCPPPPGAPCNQCPFDCCIFSPPPPPANPYACP